MWSKARVETERRIEEEWWRTQLKEGRQAGVDAAMALGMIQTKMREGAEYWDITNNIGAEQKDDDTKGLR